MELRLESTINDFTLFQKNAKIAEKRASEDCSMLVQQLAESELRVEEHEHTLTRIRTERDEAKLARADLESKVNLVEAECARLAATVAADEKLQQSFAKEKSNLLDQLQQSRALLDELKMRTAAEKEALSVDLMAARTDLKRYKEQHAEQEKKLVVLENSLSKHKQDLEDSKSLLASLRGVELKLIAAESRSEKIKSSSDKELDALRERASALEQLSAEAHSKATENLHRAERAEQEASLAQKERDRVREELKDVRDKIALQEKRIEECMGETKLAKVAFEEEKQEHIRTQKGIVDQQKLISQHAEKNQKLSQLIEEQKLENNKALARIKELEAAGSSAMSSLAFQKDLERLTSERDSAKVLVAQQKAELAKMQQMLLSVEQKGNPATAAQLEEMEAKYNATILVNKKLEKQLASIEAKYNFLKKKTEKS